MERGRRLAHAAVSLYALATVHMAHTCAAALLAPPGSEPVTGWVISLVANGAFAVFVVYMGRRVARGLWVRLALALTGCLGLIGWTLLAVLNAMPDLQIPGPARALQAALALAYATAFVYLVRAVRCL